MPESYVPWFTSLDEKYELEEAERNASYDAEEIIRNESYDTAELGRNELYGIAETSRDDLYDIAEEGRNDLYDIAEANRDALLDSVNSQLASTLNKTSVTLSHQFADATARDAYFVAHPTELVNQLYIKVGTTYQQYLGGTWTASSPVLVEQNHAVDQPIEDTGNYFTSTNTEGALQEMGVHKANTSNPHSVTKSQVGLGNCDDTSDTNKPVSIAQQAALDSKANKAQEAWITPTMLNGWVGTLVGYMIDSFGFIHLRGSVASGTINTIAFNLLAPYRPAGTKYYATESTATPAGVVYVSSGGDVIIRAGNTARISLDGINYKYGS